jgi:hypothetical protein
MCINLFGTNAGVTSLSTIAGIATDRAIAGIATDRTFTSVTANSIIHITGLKATKLKRSQGREFQIQIQIVII